MLAREFQDPPRLGPGDLGPDDLGPGDRASVEEYLAFERASEEKHGLVEGTIVAMSGASMTHNRVVLDTATLLAQSLRGGPCEPFAGDMRVKVEALDQYTYPDVVVVCGEPELEDEHFDTLTNPVVIVEVLSPSTERHDRGAKARGYREIPSLQALVLLAQDEPFAEVYERHGDGFWRFHDVQGLDAVLELPAIDARLPMAEIYARVSAAAVSSAEGSPAPGDPAASAGS